MLAMISEDVKTSSGLQARSDRMAGAFLRPPISGGLEAMDEMELLRQVRERVRSTAGSPPG